MAPGTTYKFLVMAYNRTSEAASQWTALTTTGSATSTRAAAVDTAADLTLVAVDSSVATGDSSAATGDSSSGLLPFGVTFNQAAAANISAGNGLTASVFGSPVAANAFVQGSVALRSAAALGSAASVGNTTAAESGLGATSDLRVDTVVDIALARQDYGLSRSWESFAPSSAVGEPTAADRETSLFRQSLVESLDRLFGRDIEWADVQTRAAGGESSAHALAESTGRAAGGGASEQPSAAVLAVGLALSALWSEGDENARLNPSAEPGQPLLRRRRVNPCS
jgi:hypothetical protein